MSTSKPEYVRLLVCDASGARRCRVISKELFDYSPQKGIGITQAIMGLPIFADVCVQDGGVNATGEVKLVADKNSLVKLPWCPRSYTAICNFNNHDGTPWELCPRGTLQRCIEKLKKEFHLELVIGFEVEFQLFHPDDKPFNNHLYCSSTALEEAYPILDEIYCALSEIGIPVCQFHKESAPGQYEFALQHTTALEMCDRLLMCREVINAIAIKHKLKASFIPKWSDLAAGNGNHIHVSLREEGRATNHLPDKAGKYGISLIAQYFMAGILKNLSVLTNFTVPSPNSFKRLAPSTWSGAYVCWGLDNREAPLRLTSTGDNGSPTNFEVKLMDASANPFVALAAIIIAGMEGLMKKLSLPEPVASDPDLIPEGERKERGIVRLPSSTSDAVKMLESPAGDIFREGLGNSLVKLWSAVRKSEAGMLDKLSVDEQVKMLLYKY